MTSLLEVMWFDAFVKEQLYWLTLVFLEEKKKVVLVLITVKKKKMHSAHHR